VVELLVPGVGVMEAAVKLELTPKGRGEIDRVTGVV
jgi:hypothetical protein